MIIDKIIINLIALGLEHTGIILPCRKVMVHAAVFEILHDILQCDTHVLCSIHFNKFKQNAR